MTAEFDAEPEKLGARIPREPAAGILLVAFGSLMLWAGSDLPFVTRNGVGSGLFPRLLAGLILVLGIVHTIRSLRDRSVRLGIWPVRRTAILLAAVVLFAITIRGSDFGDIVVPPLGLLVAVPAAVVVSGLAADDARIGELVVFAFVLTAVSTAIFRFGLGLSLPVAPWLIGY